MNRALRITNIIALTIFVSCFCALIIQAQSKEVRLTRSEVLIKKDKPAIYVSYEQTSNNGKDILLRLNNNTQWAINICTLSMYITKTAPLRLSNGSGVLSASENMKASVCYGVEQVQKYETKRTPNNGICAECPVEIVNVPRGNQEGHVSSSLWLPPGRSIIFIVSREHLAKYLGIYVIFNYEWEVGEVSNHVVSSELQHRVYFNNSDLPNNIQQVGQ